MLLQFFIEDVIGGRHEIDRSTTYPGQRRIIVGALIFGGITIAQLVGQARGWPIPSQLLSMMPYVATIIALTMISGRLSKNNSVVPSSLGKPFFGSQ